MARRATSPSASASAATPEAGEATKRIRLLQEDVPGYTLDQALRVPRAIADNYGFKPTRPMHVAGAMNMSPGSGPFRMISGAAVAYGLTAGAAQAPEIGITPLGLRIVRPTTEGDDVAAKREALLRPRVIGEFLRRYDGAAIPSDDIAKNVLQELGVPGPRLEGVLDLIIDGARSVGFIREWGGKRYVDLTGPTVPGETSDVDSPMGEQATTGSARLQAAAPQSAPAAFSPTPMTVSLGQGIHINIEIHIAADASSATIEEIFRNMRRYVLNGDGQTSDGATAE